MSSDERLPYESEEPCEPVTTAPPTVWKVNHGKLPSVHPLPYLQTGRQVRHNKNKHRNRDRQSDMVHAKHGIVRG
jgi:hypothetical protein